MNIDNTERVVCPDGYGCRAGARCATCRGPGRVVTGIGDD